MLRRTADDTDPVERLVVANAEQLVIVTAVADPVPRTGFVDRCLVAAYAGGLSPLLCLTKADLADPGPFAAQYAELELPVLVTRRDEPERLDGAGRRARRAGLGAGRALRGGQVDAGQRAACRTPTGRWGGSAGSARAGTRPSRRWRCRCPPTAAVGGRHPGRAVVRAGPRHAGRRARRLRRPRRRDRRLPARLRAPRTACGPRVRARHAGRSRASCAPGRLAALRRVLVALRST